MKLYISILLALFISPLVMAFNTMPADKDTVIIKFGNASKIVIFVKDKEDLDLLKEYDINGMLEDLSIAIDSAGETNNLRIEDKTGERYVKDTVIVIEDVRVAIDQDEDYEDYEYDEDDDESVSANVKIGNIRVTVDNLDDLEKLEEDFEDF